MSTSAQTLFDSLQQVQTDYEHSLPPVQSWNPELSGDIDIRIDREGRWFHEGGEISRQTMVRLFSSILKREDDDYFLVTPVEKWRIQVDVAPFLMVSMRQVEEEGSAGVVLTSNVGNDVLLSVAHPFWLETDADGNPLPLVMVRGNLPGLVNRNVFYELVELASPHRNSAGEQEWCFQSAGKSFSLGVIK